MKKYLIVLLFFFVLFLSACTTPDDNKDDDIEDVGGNGDNENDDQDNEDIEKDTYQYTHCTLLLYDEKNNYMELLNSSATQITNDTKIYKLINNQTQEASFDELMI